MLRPRRTPWPTETRDRRLRAALIAAAAAVVAVVAGLVAAVAFLTGRSPSTGDGPSTATAPTNSPTPASASLSPTGGPAETPTTAPDAEPALESATSPDEYARQFVVRLLTQDYRTPRVSLLQWVQDHSATSPEPLVMGLVPLDQRSTWAVTSVTTASDNVTPVPAQAEWDRLVSLDAYQDVAIQRVQEPYGWVAAVADGRITDPGVTAREVVAVVTRHTVEAGQAHTQRYSTALVLNVEGPPTVRGYGFVTCVTFTSVLMPS